MTLQNYINSRIEELENQIEANEEEIMELKKDGFNKTSVYELRLQRRGILRARLDEMQFLKVALLSNKIWL